MAKDTPLASITKAAISHSKLLDGVKIRATQNSTVLVFKVSCWISAIVIKEALARQGWKIEEID